MPPKSAVKRKAGAASQIAAQARKKQRTSSESLDSLRTDIETVPTLSASLPPDSGSAGVNAGASVAGRSFSATGLNSGVEAEGVSATSGEESSVAGPSSSVLSPSVNTADSNSGSNAEGTSSEQGESTGDSNPKTPHEMLGSFVEDWLETLDKEEIKSLSLFLCHHLVDLLSFTETKAAEYAAIMVKRSDCTVRRWRTGLIENGRILPESQQGRYQ